VSDGPGARSCALLGLVVAVVVAAVAASCAGGGRGDAASTSASNGAPAVTGTVVVFAASSLTDVFTQIADEVERAHPGVDVQVNAGSSSALAQQIVDGAPAAVFASADRAAMDRIGSRGVAPSAFATNELAIAVPTGNPAGVTDLAAFGDPARRTGLCASTAPCGRYARQSLERAGITPVPVTEEPDVRSLLAKVASGDLDAGIVYVTDVRAASTTVDAVPVDGDDQVRAQYLIAPTRPPDGGRPIAAAIVFVDWVLGPGRPTLRAAGFGVP
jgi:molybdate transport system substrate-binding protein